MDEKITTLLIDKSHSLREEMHLRDIPAEVILKCVEEPGFENLKNLFPHMRETRTVIGLKEYPVAIGVDWDGTLNRGGLGYFDARPENHIGPGDIIFFCLGHPPRPVRELGWENTRRSLKNGLPILTTEVECQNLLYQQTVFAYSEGMSSEKDMEVCIRWQVKNPTPERRKYRIQIFSDPRNPEIIQECSGRVFPGETKVHCWRVFYRNSNQRRELTTLPGYPFTGELFGRWNIRPEVSSIQESSFEKNLSACRNFWEDLLSKGMKVDTPEKMVNDAFCAWQVYNRINTRALKIRGRSCAVPHDGSGFYGDVYAVTALGAVHTLILTGYFKEALEVLYALLFYQKKDGLFFHKYGLCDNGGFLFVIAQYYLASGDRKGFKKLLPHARKAIDWWRKNRQPRSRDSLVSGLLRKGQYTADLAEEDYCYLSDAYNWRGIAEMSLALERAGFHSEAARLAREAEQYRKDILISMEKACFPEKELVAKGAKIPESSQLWRHRGIVQRSNLTVVPMTPVSRSLERRFLGGYYYSIVLGQLLETEILDPDSDLCRQAISYAEKRGAFLLGLLRWCEYAGIDHAYSYGYLVTKIRKDDIPGVLLGFYAMLAYGMDRDTYAGTEVVDLIEGNPHYSQKFHFQPHTLSNVMQIRLLRMMLVREEGSTLHLASIAPRHWYTGLKVENAPTIWGSVSFAIGEKNGSMEASLDFMPHYGSKPEKILLRIRDPKRRSIRSVSVNGREWKDFLSDKELINLPGTLSKASIIVRYEQI